MRKLLFAIIFVPNPANSFVMGLLNHLVITNSLPFYKTAEQLLCKKGTLKIKKPF